MTPREALLYFMETYIGIFGENAEDCGEVEDTRQATEVLAGLIGTTRKELWREIAGKGYLTSHQPDDLQNEIWGKGKP